MIYILLSAYNGSEFIEDQIESIFKQTYQNFKIICRDDGSTDDTCQIIQELMKKYEHIELVVGENIGIIKSFFSLLMMAANRPDCDYVALCDQDDVWLPEKLQEAIDHLQKYAVTRPVLYACRYISVDSHLVEMNPDAAKALMYRPAFENAIVQNIITGCCAVMNRELLNMVLSKITALNDADLIMHDWWLYLVATVFGEVIYNSHPGLLYRQHGHNASGGVSTNRWFARIKRGLKRTEGVRLQKQIQQFLQVYEHDLSQDQLAVIMQFLKIANTHSFFSRLVSIFKLRVFRQKHLDNMILKVMLLFRMYGV